MPKLEFITLNRNYVLLPMRAIYIKELHSLVLGDIHLGVEYSLAESGVYIPPLQFKRIMQNLDDAIKLFKPRRIIIVGDLKHAFHKKTIQEHKEVLDLLEYLRASGIEIFLVRGNHDNFIRGTLDRFDVTFIEGYLRLKRYIFTHGHKQIPLDNKYHFIILGHVHPTIELSDGINRAKLPVFMVKKDMIVLPSTTPLLSGYDVANGIYTSDDFFSPLIKKTDDFEIYPIIDNKTVFHLGSLSKLKKRR